MNNKFFSFAKIYENVFNPVLKNDRDLSKSPQDSVLLNDISLFFSIPEMPTNQSANGVCRIIFSEASNDDFDNVSLIESIMVKVKIIKKRGRVSLP